MTNFKKHGYLDISRILPFPMNDPSTFGSLLFFSNKEKIITRFHNKPQISINPFINLK